MTAVPFAGVPRVNLMPKSEVARRDRDRLMRLWVWIVFGAILLAFAIIAGAFALKYVADQRLAAEQARTNVLLTEIASLSEVSQALAAESELTDFRAQAMATDLAWTPVIAKVTGALPAAAALTGYDLVVGGVPQGADPTLEPGLSGALSIESTVPLDLPAIVRSLRTMDGVLFVDGRSLTTGQLSDSAFTYVLDVRFDQSVYSARFAAQGEGE